MLDQIAVSTRVGSEWIGKSRAFRSELKAIDTAMDRALNIITAPLLARLRRHPKLRAEVRKIEGTRHKVEFAIVERRLCVSWLKHDEGSDPDY